MNHRWTQINTDYYFIRYVKPIFLWFVVSTFLVSCQKEVVPAQTRFVMGTVCSVNLFDAGTPALYDQLFERLVDLERALSANLDDSEISRINHNAGIAPVTVGPDTLIVLLAAQNYAEKTGGAFDPTVGPLVKLWNIGTDMARVPSQAQIDALLPLVDYKKMQIDSVASTVYLQKTGMKLDVGAIAKGYAADVLADMVRKAGVRSALIDLGGNVYAVGTKEDKKPWKVGVKNPHQPEGKPILRLDVVDKSVVTSGVYERFFVQDGVRYHHILNAKTGYPVQNGVLSFTIIAKHSIDADALSTSAFILGAADGIELLEQEAIDGICLDNHDKMHITPGMHAYLKVLDESFVFAE